MNSPVKTKPKFVLRPVFDAGLTTIYAVAAAALCVVIVPIVLGVLIYVLFAFMGISHVIAPGFLFGGLFVLCLALTPPIYFEIRKRAFQRTFFAFYDDYVDFQYWQFLLQPRRGRIQYRDISDVYQEAGTLQAQRMLTNLLIYVPRLSQRMGMQGNFSGLKIPDLRQSANDLARVVAVIEGPQEGRTAVG